MQDDASPTSAVPADHPFDAERISAVAEDLRSRGVAYVYAAYTDVHGSVKAKASPIANFEKMARGCELFTVGAMDGMGLRGPQEDECAIVPDLDTLVVFPWDPTRALVFGRLFHHGVPFANDGRNVLIRQLDRARAMGYTFNLGLEPEFYVFREGADPCPEVMTTSRYRSVCPAYDVVLTEESMPFLDPMVRHMNELGYGVFSFDQEGGHGQHEFDFDYTDALKMADRFGFLRFMARRVASGLGLTASFMPKPFDDDFRSGSHFNMSLADARTGHNLFEPGGGDRLRERHGLPLSDLAYHFLAGQLEHAAALTAVTCPTYNSYQGLIAKGDMADISWAPVLVAYGRNNRSAMMRVPANRYAIENRAPDMSCNPYLAAAMSLAAGLDGIERGLDPGTPVNENCYDLSREQLAERGIRFLPKTLHHAVEGFRASPLAASVFGSLHGIFADEKAREFDDAFYEVHPTQRAQRLTFL